MTIDIRESVLITGGSGFLGRALARELLTYTSVRRICVYSRGEAAQAAMRAQVADPEGKLRFFIGDVRDRIRLRRAMDGVDHVIHAAALKRVEVGEYAPNEMMLTNVLGAINVVEAAQDAKVFRVVAVSTDKATAPINAYGASKLCMEKLILAANNTGGVTGPKFACARYGNVWNSTGSVLPAWRALLAMGERAVPVTDPECTRFFMTVEEAVKLVLDTLITMEGGEISIPVLPAYRLGDLAQALGAEMRVTGLPPGEKRHEELTVGCSSADARRMSVDELRKAIQEVT